MISQSPPATLKLSPVAATSMAETPDPSDPPSRDPQMTSAGPGGNEAGTGGHDVEPGGDEAEPQHDDGADENLASQVEFSDARVRVSTKVDPGQIAHFVTTIKNAEQQVGENIIRALQHEDTVAVLTTVVMTPDGQQRVVSAALNPARLQQVQEILTAAEQERQEEEPCVGFHCLVKPKSS